MDLFALDAFHPRSAVHSRGHHANPWGLWRPMMDPTWLDSLLSSWHPLSSVARANDGKSLTIRYETPGFPRDCLHIELSDDQLVLTVSGSMRKEAAPATSSDGGAADGDTSNGGPAGAEVVNEGAATGGDAAVLGPAAAASRRNAWRTVEEREFTQSYRLPRDADVKAIKADYDHGVLSITVPTTGHVDAPKARKIAIEEKDPANESH